MAFSVSRSSEAVKKPELMKPREASTELDGSALPGKRKG